MKIGIERINLYASRFYCDVAEIAIARGRSPDYPTEELMCLQRSILPPYEDSVTLAVNAARGLLTPQERAQVELVIVGTESAVDHGKPVATWVHRYVDLPPHCRAIEVKHACYGGTGALKLAAAWLAATGDPNKKALVVSTDFSRNFVGQPWELIGGGGAVAMLIGADPQVLEIDLDQTGYFTTEISDTFRPTATTEVMNDSESLYSYLDALDGAYDHLESKVEGLDYVGGLKRHIYHAPFPGMTKMAHRTLLSRLGAGSRAEIEASFQTRVAPGLIFAKRIGSIYGASNFTCLIGMLHGDPDLVAGDRISLFAYGSGCQGELYTATIGPGARALVKSLAIDRHLDTRHRLDLEAYEANEAALEGRVETTDFTPDRGGPAYESLYAGQRLLVLDRVEAFRRHYTWS